MAKNATPQPTPATATDNTVLDVTLEPSESTRNFAVFGNGTALPQHAGKCVILTNSKGQVYIGQGFGNIDPKKPIRITITQ